MNNTFFKQRVLHIIAMLSTVVAFSLNVISQSAKPNIEDKMMFRGMTGITIGGVQQHWKVGTLGSVNQQSAPLYVTIPVSNRILFSVSSSAAMADYNGKKIQSIADTRVSISYVLPGDKLWLVSGLNAPTGKTKLDTAQLKMTTLLGQPTFGYKVPSFGQGWNGNLGLTYAAPITRRFILGVGLSAFYKAKYQPVMVGQTTVDYDPGDEISANIGADYITLSKTWRFSLDLNGTYFLADKVNGSKEFQSGPRLIGLFVISAKTGTYNHTFQFRSRVRGENTIFESDDSVKTYKTAVQLEGQYSINHSLYDWLVGTATGEVKYYTDDQIRVGAETVPTGKAQIISVGTDFTFLFSQMFIPTLNFKYGIGTLVLDGTSQDVTGLEIGISTKIMF